MTTKGPSLEDLRETVALAHRVLFWAGLAFDRGHVSARVPDADRYIIKSWPHLHMSRVQAQDLIVMDLEGNIVEGQREGITRVSEWPIHAEIYRLHPDVGGVIHTHQKWATLLAMIGKPILPILGTQFAYSVAEPLPVFDMDKALVRKVQQGRWVAQALGKAPGLHLQNHGMAFAAPTVPLAVMDAINVEYQAEITWRAMQVGAPRTIPKLFVQDRLEARARGEVHEAWEHYWKWVDQHPQSLRPRAVQW